MSVKAPIKPVHLSVRQELFCRYITPDPYFDNGTLSYAAAYGYELEKLSREAIYSEPDEDGNREEIDDSPAASNEEGIAAGRLAPLYLGHPQ